MNTENIDLTISGVDFSQCIVDFEYEHSDKGSPVQPPYAEQLTIYRVQFMLDHDNGFESTFWSDLQEQHFCLVEQQILDWIHEQQKESNLDYLELAIKRSES